MVKELLEQADKNNNINLATAYADNILLLIEGIFRQAIETKANDAMGLLIT